MNIFYDFTVSVYNPDVEMPICNQHVYELKHELCRLLSEYGFGRVIFVGQSNFENEHLIPLIDRNPQPFGDISITYSVNADDVHGDITGFLDAGLYRYASLVTNDYHYNIQTAIQKTYNLRPAPRVEEQINHRNDDAEEDAHDLMDHD